MAPYRIRDAAVVKLDWRLSLLALKMAGSEERKALRKVFALFKDMPHLWHRNNAGNKSRQLGKEYQSMVKVYWEFDPTATVTTVYTKLNALVHSYVQEWQRVRRARLRHPDEPHKHRPWLWYFNDFHFIDSIIGVSSVPPGCKKNDGRLKRIGLNPNGSSNSGDNVSPATASNNSRPEASPNVFLKQRIDAVYEPHKVDKIGVSQEDKVNKEDVARFVEAQLQGVDEEKKKIALKLISDALENARLGKLTDATFSQLEGNKATLMDELSNEEPI